LEDKKTVLFVLPEAINAAFKQLVQIPYEQFRKGERNNLWSAITAPPHDRHGSPPNTTGLLSLFIPSNYTETNLSSRRYDTQEEDWELVSSPHPKERHLKYSDAIHF
jgi:hypothetical protein